MQQFAVPSFGLFLGFARLAGYMCIVATVQIWQPRVSQISAPCP